MTECSNEQAFRVGGIDRDAWDLLRVVQAEARPRLPRVVRAIHPVARGEIGSLQTFTAADVQHIRIGWRDFNGTNRSRRLRVEDRLPCASCVVGLPHTAIGDSHVEDVRLSGHTHCALGAAGTEGADLTPTDALNRTVWNRGLRSGFPVGKTKGRGGGYEGEQQGLANGAAHGSFGHEGPTVPDEHNRLQYARTRARCQRWSLTEVQTRTVRTP